MNRLHGRRALVTGAAKGLGRSYALALASEGAHTAVLDVDSTVTSLVDELSAHGVRAWATSTDIADPDSVRRAVDGAAAELGGLDIVINNAAVCPATRPVTDSFEKALIDYNTTMDVNLRGTFLVGRAAIPHLIQGGGDIVNITADHIHSCGFPIPLDHAVASGCPWAAHTRPPLGGEKFDLYDASKWAVSGLTNVWSRVLGPQGVRVNSFGMGATDTPMYRAFIGDSAALPGLMTVEDVASVLVELLAEGREGRNGDSVQLWVGHPLELPPPQPWAIRGVKRPAPT